MQLLQYPILRARARSHRARLAGVFPSANSNPSLAVHRHGSALRVSGRGKNGEHHNYSHEGIHRYHPSCVET
jgi:hypothetical protein